MLKRKNSKSTLLFSIVMVIFLMFSCSRGNPVNSAIEKSSNALTSKKNVKTAENIASTSDTNVTTTGVEEQNSDSLPYDTTSVLPFTVETYTFKTKTKNDPFVSILEQQRDGKVQIDIESAMYFGMIKGKNGKLALLKDASGLGFIFYEGQRIKNGILLKIEQDSVIFKLDEYGVVRNKVIKLVKTVDTKKKK
ncbi:MAG: hypothetical protein ABIN35_01205 [candidate division WOR-3 bacterium]